MLIFLLITKTISYWNLLLQLLSIQYGHQDGRQNYNDCCLPLLIRLLLTLLDDTAHLSQTGTGNVAFTHTARHHRNVVRVCGTQLCINVLLKKIYIIYQKLPGGHNRVLYVRKCKSIKRTQSRYESKYLCIVVFIFTDLQWLCMPQWYCF